MCRFLFSVAIYSLLLLPGCGEKQENTSSRIDAAHNARNSLDVHGTYSGNLPCGSCPGIETTIVLSEENWYTKIIYYLDEPEPNRFTTSGSYQWNDTGNTITLTGEKAPNQYFVGENVLIQLDAEGNRITGDLAGNYRLVKK